MNQIALGVDQGITNTGYAIVVRKVIESGCIKAKPPTRHPNGLSHQRGCLSTHHRHRHHCDRKRFYNKNVSSAMRTAGVIGILLTSKRSHF